jgi:hypothetical protein
MIRRFFAILPCLIVLIVLCPHARALELQQAESAKDRLLHVCAAERFESTRKLRNAFLAYAKQQAFADLKALTRHSRWHWPNDRELLGARGDEPPHLPDVHRQRSLGQADAGRQMHRLLRNATEGRS